MKNKSWTKRETNYLIDNYNTVPVKFISKVLKTPPGKVYSKIQRLKASGHIKAKKSKLKVDYSDNCVDYSDLDEKYNNKYEEYMKSEEEEYYGIAREIKEVAPIVGKEYFIKGKGEESRYRVIGVYDDFIVVEKRYKKTFWKSDFVTGKYTMEEIL